MARVLLSSSIFCLILSTMAWDSNRNLNFPRKHNIVRRSANVNYTNILNFWEKHKNKFVLNDEHKEVVLVMGNTGSGKTTLVSALIGRKLNVIERNGYLVIVDDEKRIGTGSSSTTLVPEIMIDNKKNVTYIDCSGFRDNRNVEYEISSIYFQNILMNQVEKIKLILVINHESLKINGNKNDFDDLFEHISEFIKDIPKFYDGIALVATKVENTWKVLRNKPPVLLNDNQSVLKGIANYLENKKETYLSKEEKSEKYRIFANFIDVLLQKKNDSYTRIAIFRQPTDEGLLENLPDTKSEIDIISKMVVDNLHYVEKTKDDFGFALSQSSKNIVDQIIDEIFRNALMDRLHKIGNETLIHYSQVEKQYSDIEIIKKQIFDAYNVISRITNVDEPVKLFQGFLNAVNTLNISVSLTNLNTISEDIKKLHFFTTVLNKNGDLHMMLLTNETQRFIESIKSFKYFYDFLNNLQENLAAYNSQRLQNDNRIANIIISCASSTHKTLQDIMDLENVVKEINSDEIYEKIKTLKLNRFRLKHLESVFHAFLSRLEFACTSSSEKMTVKGYNIKMSDVVENECWAHAKNIQIFALNKIFIDCSINKTGAEVQLFILAPTWEVEGKQKIILVGKAGELHENATAKSAKFTSEKGRDGLPGLPGGSAGHFFGVGEKFINSDGLEINVNGGQGGPGQHGGKGADGIAGEEASSAKIQKFVDDLIRKSLGNERRLHRFSDQNSGSDKLYGDYYISPDPPISAGNGGRGGVGGIGGYPGEIIIVGFGESINIKTSNNSGSIGSAGYGGPHGKQNYGQETVIHIVRCYRNTKCDYHTSSHAASGRRGKFPSAYIGCSGCNEKDRKMSVQTFMANPYPAVNYFKDFIRINLYENIKESRLKTLIYKLENDDQIKVHYNTLAFVKEFEGLENQFLALRNKIDFIPFYNSFLTRVEEFSMSERSRENKKVLSYIYTAALTKVLTLKKKKKGQTVMNLSNYLNIIQKSVKEISDYQHLQIVEEYRDDYKKTLNKKIQKASDFIQNTIEPEINKLWEESDDQIKAAVDEIIEKKHSIKNALKLQEKEKAKIREIMKWRAILLPLKIAAISLSFFGPVGAVAGAVVTGTISVAEGLYFDTTSSLGENKIYSLDPNLKLMSRVTEVSNNKYKLAAEKLTEANEKFQKTHEELVKTKNAKRSNREDFLQTKREILKLVSENQQEGRESKENQLEDLRNSRKEIIKKEEELLDEKRTDRKKLTDLKKEVRYEKDQRIINHIQASAGGVETIFSTGKKLENDQGMIRKIDKQMSEYDQQMRELEKMENQVYNIILPDIRQIEETINAIKSSINGSSHAKLDITKWTVQTTLRDMKSLLQKFTQKMSFEVQSNLKRYMEKIDEGFSILIDIYDRIDSYSDSIKQADYMAYIASVPMMNYKITDHELSNAVINLKLVIKSNILLEKYSIALHAFKQHFFPFAARVFQKFELPPSMRLNDIETLRSNVIEKIENMKDHIDESEATMGEYGRFIHEKKIFNSNTTGSSPFYVWKNDKIKDEVQRLLNGSEILLKADISEGLFYNSIKYNDIGINFKLKNKTLQNQLTSMLENFALTMTMIGNNYYRCGERYYFISFDDDITISYTLKQDGGKNWIDPNKIYTKICSSHTFLSPYVMWSIKLEIIDKSVSFDDLSMYVDETIDLELVGQGHYIEQNADFNFDICNEYLDTFYNVENIAQELV